LPLVAAHETRCNPRPRNPQPAHHPKSVIPSPPRREESAFFSLARRGEPLSSCLTYKRGSAKKRTESRGACRDAEEDATMRTNYAAVIVCAIVYWLLGGLWFDLLFSKKWIALEHVSEAQASSANPVWIWPFILTFLLNLLIAFVLAQVCIWRNANTAARGAAIGILLWLGVVGPIVYTTYMYDMRPMPLFAINEFYPLVGLCLMGGILGAWTKKAA
jgi:hypothetical protein